MKIVKYLILALAFISCSNDKSVVEPNENTNESSSKKLFPVNIDLQGGFESQSVYLKIDSVIYYNALLSEYIPLAGPQSSFKTFLEEGNHKLSIHRRQLDGTNTSKNDSTEFDISNFEEYYIGIIIYSDSLYVKIQDVPFMYL